MGQVLAACLLASAGFGLASAQAEPLNFAPLPSFPAAIFQPMIQQEQQRVRPNEQAAEEANPSAGTKDLRRRIVDYRTGEAPGTIVVDTPNTYLYYILGNGKAVRYGIGVGRDGFTWSGVETVTRKAEWPDWTPPPEMLRRRPDLPRHMRGGPDNPMGARALYLGDTMYRIHGSNEPHTIGTATSSGCIRMTNDDIIDLYSRVRVGATAIVQR